MTRIMVVEDDPMIAEIYQKKLTDSGFEVLWAGSGKQVLDLAKKEKVDLILLDLIMPEMDGFEVLKSLRSGEFDKNLKVVITSNLSSREDKDRAVNLGANGFIAKSEVSPAQLVDEVKRFVNQFQEQKKNAERETTQASTNEDADKRKKILLIEDEEIFLEMFGEKLRQEGYDVSVASNGAWGARKILEEKFDLLIIDMVMPAMTGEEIVEKIKLEEDLRNIPIIMLSASLENESFQKVRSLGVKDCFIKTQVTPSELAKRVGELIIK